jgi:hypothetical protein
LSSRELGIPCIVGTSSKGKPATQTIATGDDITVDAVNGVVYKGVLEGVVSVKEEQPQALPAGESYPILVQRFLSTSESQNFLDFSLSFRDASVTPGVEIVARLADLLVQGIQLDAAKPDATVEIAASASAPGIFERATLKRPRCALRASPLLLNCRGFQSPRRLPEAQKWCAKRSTTIFG